MADQNPLEWYPWYWQRWQRSRRVLRLSLAERGLYRELLDECWRVGSIPDDPAQIAEATFAPVAEVKAAWPKVRPFFTVRQDGNLTHEDLVELRRKQAKRHANCITNGKKGGRPKKPSGNRAVNPERTQNNQIRVETTLTTTAAGTPRLSGGASLPTAIASIIPRIVPRTSEQEAEYLAVAKELRA